MSDAAQQVPPDAEKVIFSFEGRTLEGVAGEPIARALYRAGVRTLSYSIKYHYPRGIRCGRGRCRQCDMEVSGTPGVPTCITPLEAGMIVRREDHRSFYAPFFTAIMRKLTLPAGFYYRIFTKPNIINKLFTSELRKMTGVGRLDISKPPAPGLSAQPDMAVTHSITEFYDIVVVGGGLAGMSAAQAAAEGGQEPSPGQSGTAARILLLEETADLGGFTPDYLAGREGGAKQDRLRQKLVANNSITVLCEATGLGFYPPDTLLVRVGPASLSQNGAMKRIRAKAFVFATGAYDNLPLFKNNHLPGIFGPRAVRLLLERDGYPLGPAAAIYGTGPVLQDTVAFLEARGIRLAAIVDAGTGAQLIAAGGRQWVHSASFRSPGPDNSVTTIRCNFLCLAFPGQSTYELPQQAGFQIKFGDFNPLDANRLLPIETARRLEAGAACFLAGEITGEMDRRHIIDQGRQAGERAAAAASTPSAGGSPSSGEA